MRRLAVGWAGPSLAFAMLLATGLASADERISLNGTVASLPDNHVELIAGQRWQSVAQPRASLEIDSRQPGSRATPSAAAQDSARPVGDKSSLRVNYVGWAPVSGGASVGLSMGVGTSSTALPFDARTAATTVSPEVGVRLRSDVDDAHRVDVSAWSAYANTPSLPAAERRSYNARVELQFQDASGKLGFDMPHGAVGMQVSGSSQMMVRAQHGGPMMYFRQHW